MTENFIWDEVDEVVPEQARTAAYFNPKGDLVIRQAGDISKEDTWVVIARPNIRGFVDKLFKLVSAAENEDQDADRLSNESE